MLIDISNGLTGEVLTTLDRESIPSAWDVMVKVATQQRLRTPYQVIVHSGSCWKRLSPLRCLSACLNMNLPEVHIVVQPLQVPTDSQHRQLLEALYHKDAGEVADLLGRGFDLTVPFLPGGHTSTLLAIAILKDNDPEDYALARPGKAINHPSQQACLTYLILQAKVHPDVLPPKQHPTTMLGLAVALKNHALVKLLVEAEAMVHPEEALVPPLTVAVLHQERAIVSTLLNALANPWMNAPVGALHDLPWSPWVPTMLEPVSAVSVAAMQNSDNGMLDLQ